MRADPGAGRWSGTRVEGELSARGPEGPADHEGQLAFDGAVLDGLSLIWSLRARPLAPGQRFCFIVYHRRALWRFEGEAGMAEEVRVPHGTFRAARLAAALRRGGASPPEVRTIRIWLSADDARIPVVLEADHPLGTVALRLTGRTAPDGRAAPRNPAPDAARGRAGW